MVKWCSDFKGI